MDFKLVERLPYGVENLGSEDGANGQCTSTPQLARRPLQQLNVSNSSSPQPQASVTPYRYHKCQVIPEEVEDQENIDPRRKKEASKLSNTSIKFQALSSDDGSPEDSSPFAYPLIWESNHTSSSSSSHSPVINVRPVEGGCCNENLKTQNLNETGGTFSGGNGSQERKVGLHCARSNLHEDFTAERNSDREYTAERNRNKGGSSHRESSRSHRGPSVTPSKCATTPSPSDISVFRTPSDRFSSNRSGDGRGAQTPQHRRVNHHHSINPFEVGAECLQLPAVSPSLFRQVVSPSQKVDSNFRWSIDQLAVLHPANIETSPFNQGDVLTDPDYERQAQDAIDKFFTHQSVVPSPWTGSNKAVNLLQSACTPVLPPPSHPTPRTNTVWCQTELTLPPNLSESVEEVLKPFCTFTQDQWWQGNNEGDEGANINNTTLRRKLLFSQEELLNATPMCSPRGADNSGVGSPSSSPVAPLPLHEDDENPKGGEEDEGLVWCSAVVGPELTGGQKGNPKLARHPPPTPPSPSMHSSHVVGRSPQISNALPFSSPNDNVLNSQALAQPRSFSSPDVSPIQHQHGTDVDYESLCSSASSLINQILHCHSQSGNHVSPRVSPVHISIESQCSVTPARNTFPSTTCDKVLKTSSSSSNSLPPNKNPKLQHEGEGYSYAGNHSPLGYSYHHNICSPIRQQAQSMVISNCLATSKNTSTLTIHELKDSNESQAIPCCSKCDMPLEAVGSQKIFSPSLKVTTIGRKPRPPLETFDQSFENIDNQSDTWHQVDKALDLTEGFTISDHTTEHQEVSVKSSPLTEPRTSSNSGHFSSSPIRDACRTPLEMDTPNRRFSSSPPLSPILCRSLMFQTQPNHHRSQPYILQDHNMKTIQLSLSQSTHMSEEAEGRPYDDEMMMMEDGPTDPASDLRKTNPILLNNLPAAVTLFQSSSICDMETDSQPSLEIIGNDEGPSQDTGYQTGSLHATNFSITACSQDSNFTGSAVPPQLKEQHSIIESVSCTQSGSSFIKVVRRGFSVSCEKEFPK